MTALAGNTGISAASNGSAHAAALASTHPQLPTHGWHHLLELLLQLFTASRRLLVFVAQHLRSNNSSNMHQLQVGDAGHTGGTPASC